MILVAIFRYKYFDLNHQLLLKYVLILSLIRIGLLKLYFDCIKVGIDMSLIKTSKALQDTLEKPLFLTMKMSSNQKLVISSYLIKPQTQQKRKKRKILSHKFEKTRGIHLALKHFFVVDTATKVYKVTITNNLYSTATENDYHTF